MNRKELISLITGTIFLFLIVFSAVTTLLGIIPFLFSKRLIDYAGIFLIISVLSFAYFTFSFLEGRESVSKRLIIAVKSVCVIFSIIFVLIGAVLTLFMSENLIKRNVSPDKKYEAYVCSDETFGGWNITVYERRAPFFKSQTGSLYVEDMADPDGDIKFIWENDSCGIQYEYYPDFDSDETQTKTQKIYYDEGK